MPLISSSTYFPSSSYTTNNSSMNINRPFVRASSVSGSSSFLHLPSNSRASLMGLPPSCGGSNSFAGHCSRPFTRSASREVSLSPASGSWRTYKPSAIVRPNTIITPPLPSVSLPISQTLNQQPQHQVRSTRSRTPLVHSCSSRSPSPLVARRYYPQYAPCVDRNTSKEVVDNEQEGDNDSWVDGDRDPSPIVIDAKLGFIMGTKCQLRQTLSPIPAHLEDTTASSYLTNKIADFLTRTDHVMDEWRRIGHRDDSCSILEQHRHSAGGRLGRSRSANNIMIRGFQYYSRASSVQRSSRSRTRDISEESTTVGDATDLDEVEVFMS